MTATNQRRRVQRTADAERGRTTRTRKVKRRRARAHKWDGSLFLAVIMLQVIGLIALFSASYSTGYYRFGDPTNFIVKQAGFAIGGFILMIILSKIEYHFYMQVYKPITAVTLGMLVLVLTPLGTVSNGARRWLFGFQPSEFAKIAVIICYSVWITRDVESVRSLKGLCKPYAALLLVIAPLLLKEPHTSATAIIMGIGVIMLFAAGMRLWYFGPIAVAGGIVFAIAYITIEHVKKRIGVWLDPFSDVQHDGYQGSMSQIAIGSGGWSGLGLGQGRQKHLYLPEPQNDFIFASWCEEMGLIGAVIVMILFGYLIYRGFMVALSAPDRFGCMMATGITAKLSIQTLMNLFVVSGVMPVTGASLPFFSYGGTSLILQFAEMGILLNISRYMRVDMRQAD